MIFEWDPLKAATNYAKHRVAFAVAVKVFDDPALITTDASEPDDADPRDMAIGMVAGVLLAIVHVMRKDACRIISARPAERKEARRYAYG